MKRNLDTISIDAVSALADDLTARLEAPLIVTVGGEKMAVLINIETFSKLVRERELLRRLALGDLEFAASEGHPLEEVLEDCELLLDES